MKNINDLSYKIIGCAFEVHKNLGPGLVEALLPIHTAQILTYLKLSKHSLGLLINFNVTNLQAGIHRYIS